MDEHSEQFWEREATLARTKRWAIVAIIAAGATGWVLGNHVGYNGGVDDGKAWQWDYGTQMGDCMAKNEQGYVDYQAKKGMPASVARDQFNGSPEWEGVRRVCQKFVTDDIGTPPRAWPWETATGVSHDQ